jgi:hypothetical protein
MCVDQYKGLCAVKLTSQDVRAPVTGSLLDIDIWEATVGLN